MSIVKRLEIKRQSDSRDQGTRINARSPSDPISRVLVQKIELDLSAERQSKLFCASDCVACCPCCHMSEEWLKNVVLGSKEASWWDHHSVSSPPLPDFCVTAAIRECLRGFYIVVHALILRILQGAFLSSASEASSE